VGDGLELRGCLAAGRAKGVALRTEVTEAGSYLRLIDSCITQLKAQRPSRTCNESKEEEEGGGLPRGSQSRRRAPPQRRGSHPSPRTCGFPLLLKLTEVFFLL